MRYFYTDPLAAAWMAKQFGMKFVLNYDEASTKTGIYCEIYSPLSHDDIDKLYIHPDSVKLLEPKENDVVFFNSHNEDFYIKLDNPILTDGVENAKIIQREGKSFMWPDLEENEPALIDDNEGWIE